jgi:colanic acid/amylovoran biosynthesis protein
MRLVDYRSLTALQKTLASADIVVASGGDVFSSDYGEAFLKRCIGPLRMAQRFGVKTAFLGQSIGPFRTSAEARVWTDVASRAELVTLRESESYSYVVNELELPPDRVFLTADPAFLLPQSDLRRTEALMRGIRLPRDIPFICIAPSQGISAFAGIDADAHREALIRIIQFLHDQTEANILIIPHVSDCRPKNDDRVLVEELLKRLDYPSFVYAALGEMSSSDFKSLISRSDLVIGERMHACIAGLSSKVCTVAIGYSVKAKGILKDVLGERENGLRTVFSVEEVMSSEGIGSRLLDVWKLRDSVRALLKDVMPSICDRARDNYRLLLEGAARE